MRLLHTERLEFDEFVDDDIPPYVILSHRWGPIKEEVSYNDFISGRKQDTAGYDKLMRFCEMAKSRDFKYCWMDTCCIDKSSSAELTEAINSMFRWYAKSKLCVAYLNDVEDDTEQSFSESLWFTRGWTLQELIAPIDVEFFNSRWERVGNKRELQELLSSITRIDDLVLIGHGHLEMYSAACIMSWAAHRKTSRIEDQAYCLMGLFKVNMPLLYGEGNAASIRLQEQILAKRQDQSLFAWGISTKTKRDVLTPLFAERPKDFEGCQHMCVANSFRGQRSDVRFEMRGGVLTICILRHRYPKATKELLALPADEHTNIDLAMDLNCDNYYQKPRYLEPRRIYLELRYVEGWLTNRVGRRNPHVDVSSEPANSLQFQRPARADYITLNTRMDKPNDLEVISCSQRGRRLITLEPGYYDRVRQPKNISAP